MFIPYCHIWLEASDSILGIVFFYTRYRYNAINGEFLNIAIIYQNAMRGVNKEIEM